MKFSRYLNIVLIIASSFIIGLKQGVAQELTTKQAELELEQNKPNIVSEKSFQLPIGVFQELAKAGINTNAKTEKEIFALTDKFMKAGGGPAKAVMNLVKTTGAKKGLKNYNYGDFKADIIQEVLTKRAKAIVPLPSKSAPKLELLKRFKYEMLNQAIKSEAFNWVSHRLKEDGKFQKRLDGALMALTWVLLLKEEEDIKFNLNNDLHDLEILLKFGANPNVFEGDYPFTLGNIGMNSLGLVLYYLQSKADKAAVFERIINVVKLLLKYGASPKLNNPGLNGSSWSYLEVILKKLQGAVGYYSGYGKEDEKTKTIKEIIKLFEKTEANKKEKSSHMGMYFTE